MDKETLGKLQEEVVQTHARIAVLEEERERLQTYLSHLEGVCRCAAAELTPHISRFEIPLSPSNYARGQFNVPAHLDGFVTRQHDIELDTPDGIVAARVNRKVNKNAAPRIYSADLRRWFETLQEGSVVSGTIETPDLIRLVPVMH